MPSRSIEVRRGGGRTWVADGPLHGVALLQEKLHEPGGDEAAGAGDADGLAGRIGGIDWHPETETAAAAIRVPGNRRGTRGSRR